MVERAPIEASGQLTSEDVYRFSVGQVVRRLWWFLCLGLVVVIIVVFSFATTTTTTEAMWPGVAALLFFLGIIPYAFFVAPHFSARKFVRTNPNLQGPSRYLFSPEGIDISSPHAEAHLSWPSIIEARETTQQILLYPQKALAHVLPKRFFLREADLAGLRELIRNHVTGKVVLRER